MHISNSSSVITKAAIKIAFKKHFKPAYIRVMLAAISFILPPPPLCGPITYALMYTKIRWCKFVAKLHNHNKLIFSYYFTHHDLHPTCFYLQARSQRDYSSKIVSNKRFLIQNSL